MNAEDRSYPGRGLILVDGTLWSDEAIQCEIACHRNDKAREAANCMLENMGMPEAEQFLTMVQATVQRLDDLALAGAVSWKWREEKLGRIATVYGSLVLHVDGIRPLEPIELRTLADLFWVTVKAHMP